MEEFCSWFSQILHDDSHFLLEEGMTVLVVSHCFQFGHQRPVLLHPAVKILDGCGRSLCGLYNRARSVLV